MTVDGALVEARRRIGGDSPGTDARLLLAHILGRDRAGLLAHGDALLAPGASARFEHLISRRALGVPVAYLTGEAWFYGLRFEVTRDVLVPRPETESLVDRVLAFAHARPAGAGLRICDVGTGSGAIAVALASRLPQSSVDAIDVSPAALAVAERNVKAHRLEGRVRCTRGDVLEGSSGVYDCIAANLPYVPAALIPGPPDPLAFEPRAALDGGPDGLTLYRRLLRRVPERLAADGMLVLEAAPPTIGALAELTRAALPGARVAIAPDAGGSDRLIVAERGAGEREAPAS